VELLLLLPLLVGVGLLELFTSDPSNSSEDPKPDDNGPTATVFSGDQNAEEIEGGGGDDVVAGGGNNDTLSGGDADDLLLGEAGNDIMSATQGYDTLLGGGGDDKIYGGRGQDLLVGGAGNDFLLGGEGADTISGSTGADTLEGFKGNDLISGLDIRKDADALAVNLLASASGAAQISQNLEDYVATNFDISATPDILARLEGGLTSANTADNADDVLFGGRGDDTLLGDFSDTMTGGLGKDEFGILSSGANEAVTVKDLDPSLDALNIIVPAGTNPAVTLVNGATPDAGVSVVIAGDVVAVLKGLTAANIPTGFIKVTVG
jgi:Ca2+-binding RTX toxin-like protein